MKKFTLLLILSISFTLLFAQNFCVPQGRNYLFNGLYYYSYNSETQLSDWVGYTLKSENTQGNANDDFIFYSDSSITGQPGYDRFRDAGYQLVQLYPQGDAKKNDAMMRKAHSLTNVIPFDYNGYLDVWRVLDNLVRGWAMLFDSIHVVTGPIYIEKPRPLFLSEGQIKIPDALFKAVLIYTELDMAAVGFIVPNAPLNLDSVAKFMYPIDSLETKTGYNFFGDLPNYIAHSLKREVKTGVLGNESYSYLIKQQYKEENQCVATSLSGRRCDVKTDCPTQMCWKHGCKEAEVGKQYDIPKK